ncbi:hypothetical protein EV401DRAFT_2012234 [Pisolithus croceorrhizus]|nr:hypothetical protein EV401DRAFT_2012234 [Pisolithus croceorrhizus]
MQSLTLRTNTTRSQRFTANLKPMWLQNWGSDSPVVKTTSGPPILPRIDTDPSLKKLLLPEERSLSDMWIPPIEHVDPTIHMPSFLDTVEERRNSSENVVRAIESNADFLISQVPLHTTHIRVPGYRLSTDSRASATNSSIEIDSQSRQRSPLTPHSTACAPTSAHARFPTQPSQPSTEKRRNKVFLALFPPFSRIRRFLAPSADRLPLTQRAVWIAPARRAEPVVVTPTRDQSQPTDPSSSPGEVILFPDDGQSTITTSEDGAPGTSYGQ